MKKIIKIGVLSSLPLIIIAQLFFYLTSRSGISEGILVYIKPTLYILFFLCATGLPIYFYLAVYKKPIKMMAIIAISWVVFSLHMLLSAVFIYPGLAKDMDFSLVNMADYFLRFTVGGAGEFILICVLITAIIKRMSGLPDDATPEKETTVAGGLSIKRALALSSLVGVILAFLNIIFYLVNDREYSYDSGITITKFFSSLSVTVMQYFGYLSFVIAPGIVCMFIGYIIILLVKRICPKKNISEFWFIAILVITYLVINVVEYLIVIPYNPI